MQFTLGAVLTVTTGRLLCPIDELYQILNHMTGDNLMTHQLIRAGDVCKGPLLAQFPQLSDVEVPKLDDEDAYRAWLGTQTALYGEHFDVEPLESWEHMNPLTELADMVGDKPIITVVTG